MDYFNVITSMVAFVENRLNDDIDYTELEKSFGYSTAHIREIFRDSTKISLSKYILYRKICNAAFEKSFKAAGRAFNILERTEKVTKEDFISFIKAEIDEGRPVIALGIIGPPEACIVTGYRDNGHTLLGWNFFQECNEFAKDIEIDESGYFISKNWWENPCTIGLMSIGEDQGQQTPIKEILQNAIDILTKEQIGVYAGGQASYDHWANSLLDETQFPRNAVMPMLFERIMCQCDATCMIGEGRYYGAAFLEWLGDNNEDIKEKCYKAAKYFKQEFTVSRKMGELIEENQPRETQARKLGEPSVRKELAKCIMESKRLDYSGCEVLREIVEMI